MTRRTLIAGLLAHGNVFAASYMALDVDGATRDLVWPDAERPRSVGSLLKPFLAVAYLATHAKAPVVECSGSKAGCWHPQGHGSQDIVAALANSCNVYFLRLASDLDRAALDVTCLSYGLSAPPRDWSSARLIGLGEGWPQTPAATARAFAGLARNTFQPDVKLVLAGMLRCSVSGTAKAAGVRCYAKTGTAVCCHSQKGCGDGYAVAIHPPEQPRSVLLVARHDTTGAHTARDLGTRLA